MHRSRVDEVIKELSIGVNNLQGGLPWKQGVSLTPLADLNAAKWLKELIDEAVSMGAKVMNEGGGETIENFMHPAIVYPVALTASADGPEARAFLAYILSDKAAVVFKRYGFSVLPPP